MPHGKFDTTIANSKIINTVGINRDSTSTTHYCNSSNLLHALSFVLFSESRFIPLILSWMDTVRFDSSSGKNRALPNSWNGLTWSSEQCTSRSQNGPGVAVAEANCRTGPRFQQGGRLEIGQESRVNKVIGRVIEAMRANMASTYLCVCR